MQPKLAPTPRSTPQALKLTMQHAHAVSIIGKSTMLVSRCMEVIETNGFYSINNVCGARDWVVLSSAHTVPAWTESGEERG